MNAKKALTWTGVAFIAFWCLTYPGDVLGTVHHAFSGLERVVEAVANFTKSLVGPG